MQNKACAIICEYNPFHNGHKYQIEYIKENYGLPCVCIMSGNFVQRGEIAFADKYARAKKAVENGAQIVLELPFPYCCMTAEKFAMSGVEIAEKCGMCSHIAFGSECADIEKIKAVAVLLLDADFKKELERSRKENPEKSFASLRCDAVREKLGEEYAKILENPNDILAVEYVKAIIKKKSALVPIAVKRTVRFDEERGEFAPSSFIRRKFYEKDEKNGKYLPYNISEIKKDIFGEEKINEFKKNVHISLLRETPERLKNISELGGGLEYALICAVKNSENIGEALEKLRCKTLTNAKIRRMFLFSFFGVTKEMEKEMPEYTSVLAMSESECAAKLMRIARKEKRIIIAQKAGAVRKNKKAYEQYKFCENAEKILKIC